MAWPRFLRRLWRPFLNKAEKAHIVAAIAEQERHTTGEIHVHVVAWAGRGDILALAQRKFAALGLQQCAERNGVLILVSHMDHRFAIWGDEGVHAKAGQTLWAQAEKVLLAEFAQRRYAAGIESAVREIGGALARLFPKASGPGANRLSNEISGDLT
ncbi:MAG TPA: TPM domain-containing protein [Rhodocyclaceae bacterium]